MSSDNSPADTGSSPDRGRFYLLHVGVPASIALVIFAAYQIADVDRTITAVFYDANAHDFPLRHNWFLDVVLHHWAKYVLVFGAALLFGAVAFLFLLPGHSVERRAALFIFLAMILGPLTAAGLRQVSNSPCPNELSDYGGYAASAARFQAGSVIVKRRGCFPDDHAAGGFGLTAWYFFWYRRNRRLARTALGLGLAVGLMLGLGRVMQGAHFVSDEFWSATICWAGALALNWLILDRELSASHLDFPHRA